MEIFKDFPLRLITGGYPNSHHCLRSHEAQDTSSFGDDSIGTAQPEFWWLVLRFWGRSICEASKQLMGIIYEASPKQLMDEAPDPKVKSPILKHKPNFFVSMDSKWLKRCSFEDV